MMRFDEYDLELAHVVERGLERDEEHERFDARPRPVARRQRYSRFLTLARITDAIAAAARAEQPGCIDRKEAA